MDEREMMAAMIATGIAGTGSSPAQIAGRALAIADAIRASVKAEGGGDRPHAAYAIRRTGSAGQEDKEG